MHVTQHALYLFVRIPSNSIEDFLVCKKRDINNITASIWNNCKYKNIEDFLKTINTNRTSNYEYKFDTSKIIINVCIKNKDIILQGWVYNGTNFGITFDVLKHLSLYSRDFIIPYQQYDNGKATKIGAYIFLDNKFTCEHYAGHESNKYINNYCDMGMNVNKDISFCDYSIKNNVDEFVKSEVEIKNISELSNSIDIPFSHIEYHLVNHTKNIINKLNSYKTYFQIDEHKNLNTYQDYQKFFITTYNSVKLGHTFLSDNHRNKFCYSIINTALQAIVTHPLHSREFFIRFYYIYIWGFVRDFIDSYNWKSWFWDYHYKCEYINRYYRCKIFLNSLYKIEEVDFDTYNDIIELKNSSETFRYIKNNPQNIHKTLLWCSWECFNFTLINRLISSNLLNPNEISKDYDGSDYQLLTFKQHLQILKEETKNEEHLSQINLILDNLI
jgi:hypothetical protein